MTAESLIYCSQCSCALTADERSYYGDWCERCERAGLHNEKHTAELMGDVVDGPEVIARVNAALADETDACPNARELQREISVVDTDYDLMFRLLEPYLDKLIYADTRANGEAFWHCSRYEVLAACKDICEQIAATRTPEPVSVSLEAGAKAIEGYERMTLYADYNGRAKACAEAWGLPYVD